MKIPHKIFAAFQKEKIMSEDKTQSHWLISKAKFLNWWHGFKLFQTVLGEVERRMGFSYLLSMGACSVLFFPQKAYICMPHIYMHIYMPPIKIKSHTDVSLPSLHWFANISVYFQKTIILQMTFSTVLSFSDSST